MSRQLNCEIIRDLLPSYADGQTSDITNTAIEEHISECRDCADMLRRMKEPEEDILSQKEEINYLKKVKKSKRLTAWISTAIALVIGLIAAGLFIFVRGTAADLSAHAVNVQVDGNAVYVDGVLTSSGEGVARVTFTEKDGVVDIKLFTAPIAPFNRGSFSETYTVKSNPIKAVTGGGLVLWENGEKISNIAGRLYAAKNPYVGNMSANQKIANIIGLNERYGAYKNELQTSKEPYGWIVILEEPVAMPQDTRVRQKMLSDACIMIAAVDKAASEFAGAEIKSFAESASKMEKLVKVVR